MTKLTKIYHLWKEVKALRKENKDLASKLRLKTMEYNEADRINKELVKRLQTEQREYKVMFSVPQSQVIMNPWNIGKADRAEVAYAEHTVAEMTDRMKIQMFDELLENGYIKAYESTPLETRYEIRCIKDS